MLQRENDKVILESLEFCKVVNNLGFNSAYFSY